jgi:excisionase family DNA binding protein
MGLGIMTEERKEILNIDEACRLLGVSSRTFAKVLREDDIPGRKIGREWKFSRQALIDWVGSARAKDFIDKRKKKQRAVKKDRKVRPAHPSGRGPGRVQDRFSIEED